MPDMNEQLAEIASELKGTAPALGDQPNIEPIQEPVPEPEPVEIQGEEGQEGEPKAESDEITTIAGLVEAIEVEPEFLYGLDVPMGDNEPPVKLGALKDQYVQARRESRDLQSQLTQYKEQLQTAQTQSTSAGQWSNEMIQAQGQMAAIQQQNDATNWNDESVDKGELAYYKQNLMDTYAKAQTAFNQAQQNQQNLAQQTLQQNQQTERAALLQAVPAWADEKVAQTEKRQIVEAAQDYGFNEQDLQNVIDHRVVWLLRDLMKLKRQDVQAKESIKKIQKAPRVLGARTPKRSSQENVKQLIQQAQKGGRNRKANELAAAKAILAGG